MFITDNSWGTISNACKALKYLSGLAATLLSVYSLRHKTALDPANPDDPKPLTRSGRRYQTALLSLALLTAGGAVAGDYADSRQKQIKDRDASMQAAKLEALREGKLDQALEDQAEKRLKPWLDDVSRTVETGTAQLGKDVGATSLAIQNGLRADAERSLEQVRQVNDSVLTSSQHTLEAVADAGASTQEAALRISSLSVEVGLPAKTTTESDRGARASELAALRASFCPAGVSRDPVLSCESLIREQEAAKGMHRLVKRLALGTGLKTTLELFLNRFAVTVASEDCEEGDKVAWEGRCLHTDIQADSRSLYPTLSGSSLTDYDAARIHSEGGFFEKATVLARDSQIRSLQIRVCVDDEEAEDRVVHQRLLRAETNAPQQIFVSTRVHLQEDAQNAVGRMVQHHYAFTLNREWQDMSDSCRTNFYRR